MSLGEVIAAYRKEHGLSMEKFSELSGISKGYISMLERNRTQRGDTPSPSFEMYRNVAKAIGMDVDELIRQVDGTISLTPAAPTASGIPPMPDLNRSLLLNSPTAPLLSNLRPLPTLTRKPRLGSIACGKPILAVEEAEVFDFVPTDIECDFTLLCQGNSMINARIFDGDVVYIRQQPEVENGEIAAVRIGDEATLKKVYYTPGSSRITLRACNPLYPDLEYEGDTLNDIEILGKAIAFTSRIK